MKLLSFLVAMLVMLPPDPDGLKGYWDILLDKYEALCNACREKKSKKEIRILSDSVNEMLKHPEGKMNPAQKKRFATIQNNYRGFVTISDYVPSEIDAPRVVKVDTIRRVEHIQVVDTVFVKEILGSIHLEQYTHNTDTVYHFVQIQTLPPADPPGRPETKPEAKDEPAGPMSVETVHQPSSVARPSFLVAPNVVIGTSLSYGLTVAVFDKWGGYAGFHSNFKNVSTGYTCTSDGMTESGSRIMTNGNATCARLAVTAGVCYEVNKWLVAYAGAGFGRSSLAWQDVDGTWVDVSDISVKGVEIEAGGFFRLGRFALSLGATTTRFRRFDLKLGVGVTF